LLITDYEELNQQSTISNPIMDRLMPIEPSQPDDLAPILAMTEAVGVFNAEEVATVQELFEAYLKDAVASGYHFLSYRENDQVLGFVCWGPKDLSNGATDLYWIVTSPAASRRGVAATLFQAVETAVRALGRWLIVIWTSSRPAYEPARRFYERMGCTLAAQIPEFYDRGDDLCIYTRHL
jgi:GNAT superfamily N-acetyltransferase